MRMSFVIGTASSLRLDTVAFWGSGVSLSRYLLLIPILALFLSLDYVVRYAHDRHVVLVIIWSFFRPQPYNRVPTQQLPCCSLGTSAI